MREIGSEFWDVPVSGQKNEVFPASARWFLSGRCALRSVINELKDCHTVAMPSWCCDSMIKPFADSGMEVRFYPVYWQNGLVQEPREDCDVLFRIDYFGYSASQKDPDGYAGVVIRDITHSLFTERYADSDYYFGSLRKWCGLWTGGYAWTADGHPLLCESRDEGNAYAALRCRAMEQKSAYINGSAEDGARTDADKSYLHLFQEAEDMLDETDCTAPAAERDVQLAMKLDAEYIATRRRRNAGVLMSAFRDWLVFPEMKEEDCPLFVPVLVPDGKRDELRRYLINHGIYCPVHWPVSGYHRIDERTGFLYRNELSLVCDQRYTVEDMNRIVETVSAFREEG